MKSILEDVHHCDSHPLTIQEQWLPAVVLGADEVDTSIAKMRGWGYPFVSRNGIVAAWEKKVGIRYQA